jgi:O-acetyl-ADP-ribose deacetylase (regulator of RNase III)
MEIENEVLQEVESFIISWQGRLIGMMSIPVESFCNSLLVSGDDLRSSIVEKYNYLQKILDKLDGKTYTIEGDLLDQKTDVIAHQVNCLGVMGAGVAYQIRNKWPDVYERYKNFCHDELERLGTLQARLLLGKCLVCIPDDGIPAVANLFGQDCCNGEDRMTSYDALYDALTNLRRIMENHKWKSVAFPYGMSCGLGGGSWNVIYAMICDVFENSDIGVQIVKK